MKLTYRVKRDNAQRHFFGRFLIVKNKEPAKVDSLRAVEGLIPDNLIPKSEPRFTTIQRPDIFCWTDPTGSKHIPNVFEEHEDLATCLFDLERCLCR